MPLRTVDEYLKRWGFTQKQSTPAVFKWLLKDFPEIAKRAKQDKAEIYWGDENGIQTDDNVEYGYSPRGETPVLRQPTKRTGLT